MKKTYKFSALVMMCLMLLGFAACSNDDLNTDQYGNGIALNSFGPSPVVRGGTLRFLGSNLDQIKEVDLPGVGAITAIDVVTKGKNSEIRIQVPVDGPEVGFVTLVTPNDGNIVTKTKLTYTENIVFESMSPEEAMAGDVITIKGDYLNLIHEVIFADEVVVPEEQFLSHTRYEITVAVPEAAQTGKVIISDGDADMPNWVYSDNALAVGVPTCTAMTPTNLKAGAKMTFTGTDFGLVDHVAFKNAEGAITATAEKIAVSEDKKTITCDLPENVFDGEVVLVCKSGVEIAAGTVAMVMPTNLKATPNPIRSGETLTISGSDMDVVTSIAFEGSAEALKPATQSATAVTVEFPADAKSGNVTLSISNGTTSTVAIVTVKPSDVTYTAASADAGGQLTLKGKNLDVISSITFAGGVSTDVTPTSATSLTCTVPTTAETGKLKLNMANGESVEAPSLTVNKPVCAWLPSIPAELTSGEVIELDIVNGSMLTGVSMNDAAVQYINNTSTAKLTINVPASLNGACPLTLTSSNGTITYNVKVVSAKQYLWKGNVGPTNWSGDKTVPYDAAAMSELLVAGKKLGFDIVCDNTQTYWQVRFMGSWWTELPSVAGAAGSKYDAANSVVAFGADDTEFIMPLTDGDIDIIKNQGFLFCGNGVFITGIYVTK